MLFSVLYEFLANSNWENRYHHLKQWNNLQHGGTLYDEVYAILLVLMKIKIVPIENKLLEILTSNKMLNSGSVFKIYFYSMNTPRYPVRFRFQIYFFFCLTAWYGIIMTHQWTTMTAFVILLCHTKNRRISYHTITYDSYVNKMKWREKGREREHIVCTINCHVTCFIRFDIILLKLKSFIELCVQTNLYFYLVFRFMSIIHSITDFLQPWFC